jgi:hypothetical protein
LEADIAMMVEMQKRDPRFQTRDPIKLKIFKPTPAPKKASIMSEKDDEHVRQALAEIETAEASDLDDPGWSSSKERYRKQTLKRGVEVESTEADKRKVSFAPSHPRTRSLMPPSSAVEPPSAPSCPSGWANCPTPAKKPSGTSTRMPPLQRFSGRR